MPAVTRANDYASTEKPPALLDNAVNKPSQLARSLPGTTIGSRTQTAVGQRPEVGKTGGSSDYFQQARLERAYGIDDELTKA